MIKPTDEQKQAAHEIDVFATTIQTWYRAVYSDEVHPMNEICYATAGIMKEVVQGLMGGNFSTEYLKEKCETIMRLAEIAKREKGF